MRLKFGFIPFLILTFMLLVGEKGYASMIIPEPYTVVSPTGISTDFTNHSISKVEGAWLHDVPSGSAIEQGYFKWSLKEGDSWGFIYYEYINGLNDGEGLQEITRTTAVPTVTAVLQANEAQFTFSTEINGHIVHGIGFWLNTGSETGNRYVAWQGAITHNEDNILYTDFVVAEPIEEYPPVPDFSIPQFAYESMTGWTTPDMPIKRTDNSVGQVVTMPSVPINTDMQISKPSELPVFNSLKDRFITKFGLSSAELVESVSISSSLPVTQGNSLVSNVIKEQSLVLPISSNLSSSVQVVESVGIATGAPLLQSVALSESQTLSLSTGLIQSLVLVPTDNQYTATEQTLNQSIPLAPSEQLVPN